MDRLKSGKSHRFDGGIFNLVLRFMGRGPGIGFTLLFSLAGGLMIGIAGAELDSPRASSSGSTIRRKILPTPC